MLSFLEAHFGYMVDKTNAHSDRRSCKYAQIKESLHISGFAESGEAMP